MCGKFVGAGLVECEVDGAKMLLCPQCLKFGSKTPHKSAQREENEEEFTFIRSKSGGKEPSVSHVKVGSKEPSTQIFPTRIRKERDILTSELVLTDDFGEKIKEARIAKNWSLEKFAQMINEKASILQKIEKSEFNPPESLIIKIERKLGISLREEAAPPIYLSSSITKETTLGDVVKLKKKKKDN